MRGDQQALRCQALGGPHSIRDLLWLTSLHICSWRVEPPRRNSHQVWWHNENPVSCTEGRDEPLWRWIHQLHPSEWAGDPTTHRQYLMLLCQVGNPFFMGIPLARTPWKPHTLNGGPRGTVSTCGWGPVPHLPCGVCAAQGGGHWRWVWGPWLLLTSPGPPMAKGSILASPIPLLPRWQLFLIMFCGSINLDAFFKVRFSNVNQWDVAWFITDFLINIGELHLKKTLYMKMQTHKNSQH